MFIFGIPHSRWLLWRMLALQKLNTLLFAIFVPMAGGSAKRAKIHSTHLNTCAQLPYQRYNDGWIWDMRQSVRKYRNSNWNEHNIYIYILNRIFIWFRDNAQRSYIHFEFAILFDFALISFCAIILPSPPPLPSLSIVCRFLLLLLLLSHRHKWHWMAAYFCQKYVI